MSNPAAAFGFEDTAPDYKLVRARRRIASARPPGGVSGKQKVHPPPPPQFAYNASPISERNLHSDRYMAEVQAKIPELLHHYFDFPTDYAEGGRVAHVVQLLRDMFAGGRLLAEWATDHGKSLAGTFFFPILSAMENPDEAHIIVGANLNDSKRRLQSVQRELEENRDLIRDFPWLKKPSKDVGGTTWSRTELTVAGRSANKPNPTLYACTIGSDDIRQRRGKLIMDDIESDKVRHYALQRRQLKEFIGYAALRCYEDAHESSRPLAIALGTPMDNDSVYFWLEQQLDWKVSKLPAYSVDWKTIFGYAPPHKNTEWGRAHQMPWRQAGQRIPQKYFSWPLKRDKILSQDPWFGRGMTKEQFSLNFLLDPSAGDPLRLTLQQIEKYVREAEFAAAEDWLTLVCFDPASGSESRWADYCGISVVRIRWPRNEKLPQLQVLEAYKFTSGLFEQVALIADLCQQHQCKCLYETNSQQGAIYLNAFRHLRPDVQLLPHFTSRDDKYDEKNGLGLTVVRTLVKSQRLQVPEENLESEGMQALLREIRDLGSDKSADHLSMSVWFAIRYLYQQVQSLTAPVLVPTLARSWSGGAQSWKSWRR